MPSGSSNSVYERTVNFLALLYCVQCVGGWGGTSLYSIFGVGVSENCFMYLRITGRSFQKRCVGYGFQR
jgi:hypothetical protein